MDAEFIHYKSSSWVKSSQSIELKNIPETIALTDITRTRICGGVEDFVSNDVYLLSTYKILKFACFGFNVVTTPAQHAGFMHQKNSTRNLLRRRLSVGDPDITKSLGTLVFGYTTTAKFDWEKREDEVKVRHCRVFVCNQPHICCG